MSKLRSWWQPIRHRLLISLIGVGISVVLAALVYEVIRFGWGWTGFAGGASQVTVKGATEDTVYVVSKTLWDWMQLLLVPVMLAIGGFWLNQLQKGREERATEQRDKVEREIAEDNQQEAALQSYLDKIGELLLREQEHLGSSPGNPQVENIARARTVTALPILNPARRVSLLRFLGQAGVLQTCVEGKLPNIDLHGTDLAQFNLSKFDLVGANLSGVNLFGADLSEADLSFATLNRAILNEANLSFVALFMADLSGANLNRVNLSGANLVGADLSGTILVGTNLNRAILVRADLSGADLREAKLIKADLRDAKGLTDEQQADYQSRGALIGPVPSTVRSISIPLPPASSTPQHKGKQGRSSPPAQAIETPLSVGDMTPSMQKEDSADANRSGTLPSQPSTPS